MLAEQYGLVVPGDCLANLLNEPGQDHSVWQLEDVMSFLVTGLEIRLAPTIGVGERVKIKSGTIRGVGGWVGKQYGATILLLRPDFTSKAAAVEHETIDLPLL